MSIPAGVLAAVQRVTSNPREQAALLYACAAESGCQSIQNAAGAPAWGPWQIYLPFHPGVTIAEANDPAYAANYIYTRRNVPGCVQAQDWSQPMTAAFNAARCIEGGTPAEPYSQAQQQAGQMAANIALNGGIQSGATGATGNGAVPILSGLGNFANNIPGVKGISDTAGALTGIAAMFAHLLDFLSSPDFWISLLLVFIGFAFVIVGVGKVASSSPAVQKIAAVAPMAAAA